ncbi:MAG: ATP-grasp domain-containing protein [Nitriliruptoraceae bacterium]
MQDVLAVVGLRPHRVAWLERIGRKCDFEVAPILPYGRVRRAASYDIDELLAEARSNLAGTQVAGIATYWDFPASCLVPILAEERGLPTPSLRAEVSFEHKYWSRLLQQRVAPRDTPDFAAVDVFTASADDAAPLPFPFWLKPFKSYSGHLGFRVDSAEDYRRALGALRDGIHRLGGPFQEVLDRIDDLPSEVAEVGGSGAIAEQIIDGQQYTLEGHVCRGEVDIHGVFAIERGEDGSTFTHYLYPSHVSASARGQMRDTATGLMQEAGYDDAAFNIEFFIDEEAGRAWILEVNPRISQEHSHLMDWVDGATNLEVMAQIALGRRPTLLVGEGEAAVAAKFFVREWRDAIVTSAPDEDRIQTLEERYAPCAIDVTVQEGDRLSELPDQEAYSYIVAYVYLGRDSEEELHEAYEAVVDDLALEVAPPG